MSVQAASVDFDLLERQVVSLLEGERDFVANAGNFAALVLYEVPGINWAGFYFPSGDGLLLGPFAGRPACVRLPAGQGVCNLAFVARHPIVVDDVSTVKEHVQCDPASRSEMVVPLIVDEQVRGVFDVDSPQLARFDQATTRGIERLVSAFMRHMAHEGSDSFDKFLGLPQKA